MCIYKRVNPRLHVGTWHCFQKKTNNSVETNRVNHILGHIKSGQAYLVAKRNQNQRKTMFQNFDFLNKPICSKINILQVFEAKISTELFISNCLLEKSEIKKFLSRRMFI